MGVPVCVAMPGAAASRPIFLALSALAGYGRLLAVFSTTSKECNVTIVTPDVSPLRNANAGFLLQAA